MTTKEYLSQIIAYDRRAKTYQRQVEQLKAQMYSVKAISYDKDKVQTSATDDQMLRLIAKVDSTTKRWLKIVDRSVAIRDRIIAEIQMVERRSYRDLLTYRYVDGMSWAEVAEEMDIENMRSLFYIHGRALKDFEKIKRK